ncbi:MAG: prepilin-type N-terminal cleavage/methylation domain-containing protein [Burkholderiaceae bacterium]|jgi:type IV pilus assembly protein PilE|nr:prepilin-type N-terminal cleavage/methylation domain-containing protein [Burkholderiaceae bacterium]
MTRLPARRSHRGFTLVEVMIAVVVVGLLSALAYPSYQAQVAKSRRTDAKQSLVELSQKMERFYTERGTYVGATLGATGLYPLVTSGGYYDLSITAQTLDGFTVKAAPRGTQVGDACASFLYNQLGEQMVSNDASLSAVKCWQ